MGKSKKRARGTARARQHARSPDLGRLRTRITVQQRPTTPAAGTEQHTKPAYTPALGPLVLVLVFLALALLITHLPMPPLTGATVRSDRGYDYIIEQQFDSSTILTMSLQHYQRSIAMSADVTGSGTAMVYLETADGPKKIFVVQGDASGPAERRVSVRHACEETCTGLSNEYLVHLHIIVNGATLTLHNISYTTGQPPTGAAVVDGYGNEILADTIPHAVYDWLMIGLTVLTVVLLVLGPIRKQSRGNHPATASAIGIIAIATATALLALLDAFNHHWMPSVVLGVTMACALVLDIMLFREKKPGTYHEHDLPVFTKDASEPDEREIRRRIEQIRKRLRQ